MLNALEFIAELISDFLVSFNLDDYDTSIDVNYPPSFSFLVAPMSRESSLDFSEVSITFIYSPV